MVSGAKHVKRPRVQGQIQVVLKRQVFKKKAVRNVALGMLIAV